MNHFICQRGYISCFVSAVDYSLHIVLGWGMNYILHVTVSYTFWWNCQLYILNWEVETHESKICFTKSLIARKYWLSWVQIYYIQYFISDLWTARISACSLNLQAALLLCSFSPFPLQLCSFQPLYDLEQMFCPLNGFYYWYICDCCYILHWMGEKEWGPSSRINK